MINGVCRKTTFWSFLLVVVWWCFWKMWPVNGLREGLGTFMMCRVISVMGSGMCLGKGGQVVLWSLDFLIHFECFLFIFNQKVAASGLMLGFRPANERVRYMWNFNWSSSLLMVLISDKPVSVRVINGCGTIVIFLHSECFVKKKW